MPADIQSPIDRLHDKINEFKTEKGYYPSTVELGWVTYAEFMSHPMIHLHLTNKVKGIHDIAGLQVMKVSVPHHFKVL